MTKIHFADVVPQSADNNIQITQVDKNKMEFVSCCGHFGCRGIQYSPTNTPATYQSKINHCQESCIDDCTVSNFDNILIRSAKQTKHEEHVCHLLHRLQQLGRYSKVNISKMYFSHFQPPGVSERMWSVNLDASISGEYQTIGGHSGRPWE